MTAFSIKKVKLKNHPQVVTQLELIGKAGEELTERLIDTYFHTDVIFVLFHVLSLSFHLL